MNTDYAGSGTSGCTSLWTGYGLCVSVVHGVKCETTQGMLHLLTTAVQILFLPVASPHTELHEVEGMMDMFKSPSCGL